MTHYLVALSGGLLIGLAAALLLYVNGRIAGISGILGGTLKPQANDFAWRASFMAGLVATGLVMARVWPAQLDLSALPALPGLAIAGLLVGFGTRLGNGCTSGHGVCGIARGSRRSMLATVTFMAAGVVTVFIVRHVS
jgi:uncharacterized membrane protein YedE/YeeE